MADDDWDPSRNPGHYFSRIARALTRIGDARLRPIGFATAQLPVLAALKDSEAMSQTELARWAKVEQPSMAQMLARMEREGMIERRPDPRDRRASLVSLTEQARARRPRGPAPGQCRHDQGPVVRRRRDAGVAPPTRPSQRGRA
jgi:MarR family transcriptional regulator, transcriptional regulator for hemolysin